MTDNKTFDVIIIGGSYSGLAAAMALGRSLKQVLIIDSGKPCNRQTPHSHNFLTQDGRAPGEIAMAGRQQVAQYSTVQFLDEQAVSGKKTDRGFEIAVASGKTFEARKLVFATGIRDIMPGIEGIEACWGISVLHCPYCHGYEVRGEQTGILNSGDIGFEFAKLIANWTKDLTLYTNGPSGLNAAQMEQLNVHQIRIVEKEIVRLEHADGYVHHIVFRDGTKAAVKALYARVAFEQHSDIPRSLGCTLTDDGYIYTDMMQETSVKGVFACGDNATRIRTVANAVATGTAAGIVVNKELVFEDF